MIVIHISTLLLALFLCVLSINAALERCANARHSTLHFSPGWLPGRAATATLARKNRNQTDGKSRPSLGACVWSRSASLPNHISRRRAHTLILGVTPVPASPLFTGPDESMSCEIIQGGVMISYRRRVLASVAVKHADGVTAVNMLTLWKREAPQWRSWNATRCTLIRLRAYFFRGG